MAQEFTWLCAFTSMGYAPQELTFLTIFYQFLHTLTVRHHKRRYPCVNNCATDCWRSTVNKSIMYRKGSEMWIEWLRNFLPDSGNNTRFYTQNEQPFLVTMSTWTNKHRYKNKLLGMEENIARNQQFYRQNFPISYLHRQFNDRYINSFNINVYFTRYIFQGWIAL